MEAGSLVKWYSYQSPSGWHWGKLVKLTTPKATVVLSNGKQKRVPVENIMEVKPDVNEKPA